MKSKLLFILLILPVYLFSQNENDRIIYLDSSYNKVSENDYVYTQIIRDHNLVQDSYIIEEYYKSGQLKMKGVSTENVFYKYFGYLTHYYENGTLQDKLYYKNGKPDGLYFSWYENGLKKIEGAYIADKFSKTKEQVLKVDKYWDTDGIEKVTDGNGSYIQSYPGFYASGKLKNGLKEGLWTGNDKNIKVSFEENYNNGEFISGVSIDENGIEHSYTEITVRPSPKKGLSHFYKFVGKKFNIAPKITTKGTIYLKFIVSKNGEISKTEVFRGVHPVLDREAIRVLNLYADWKAGEFRGVPINVSYSIPIRIQ